MNIHKLAAKSNVVLRQPSKKEDADKVWLAAPGAKQGFLVPKDEAPNVLSWSVDGHAMMYKRAFASGMTAVRAPR